MLAPSSSGRISIGVAKVLSTISGTSGARARSRRSCPAARTRSSGFEMVSMQHAPGLSSASGLLHGGKIADVDEVGLDAEGAEDGHQHVVVAP